MQNVQDPYDTVAYVTTLMHATFSLSDPFVRSILLQRDGSRDRSAILGSMQAEFPAMSTAELENGIERGLGVFYRSALLEA